MKNYDFDGHKLMYHPERVAQFITNGDCYPLYMEISPIGVCNHRCIFCAYDFIGYPRRKLQKKRTLALLDELAECGLKSILFAGEGEPLLHPDIAEFIKHAHGNGIDVGLFTNGQLLKSNLSEIIMPELTFVRLSFNGGTPDNYAKVHSVRPKVYETVLSNITEAVRIKQKYGLQVDIGAQFVLLPENIEYLISAAYALKECGIDYFTIKPFMQRDKQAYQLDKQYSSESINGLLANLNKIQNHSFNVIFRNDAFSDYGIRNYHHCYGTSLITVLNSAGKISSCLPYWDRDEFCFGSIYEHSFQDLWKSERRKVIKAQLERSININCCPPNCRPNAVNEFLWNLMHPQVKHINFI